MCTICLVNKKESTLCRLFCLLNKNIQNNDFAEQIPITNIAMNNPFVAHCDGYIKISRSYKNVGTTQVEIRGSKNDKVSLYLNVVSTTSNSANECLFVRKGTRIAVIQNTDNVETTYFIPLQ